MQSPSLKDVCCPLQSWMSVLDEKNTTSKPRSSSSAASRHDFAAKTVSSIFPNTHFTNHESLPSLQESLKEFTKAYPQYSQTYQIDRIRAEEYIHLSYSNNTCLDYIGIGLFSYFQKQNRIASSSSSSSSCYSSTPMPDIPFFGVSYKTGNLKTQLLYGGQESKLESAIKKRIMGFLRISEDDYCMVFTANKTSAFKLVAESYPFRSNKKLLTVYDYESEAVEAMINSSEKKGAHVMSAEFSWPRLRIHSEKLRKMVVGTKKMKNRGLFVFPVHSRMTGTRYPYLWMSIAQDNGWHVLLDACALGPKDMDSFGLSLYRPDFLICSFYKVFGENPSGFGCLFVKKSTLSKLDDSTGSGMVSLVQAQSLFPEFEQEKIQKPDVTVLNPSETLESVNSDDSIQEGNNSLEIKCRGLDQVDSLGMRMISNRLRCLINWLVNALLKLQHPNTEGVPLIRIYGPKIKFDRGPALSFNVFDWKGEKVEPVLVQKLADRNNISLSYGFLHHIWFKDKYQDEKDRVLQKAKSSTSGNKKRNRIETGITVVTAALGFLANFEDTYKLWAFVAQFLDADFVEKERWRYTALNQKTVEV